MRRCLCLLALLGCWASVSVPGRALAEDWVDELVPTLRSSYEYGRYAEVLERATRRIDQGRLSEQDLLELHKLAGLSAFNLNRADDATRHFRALLRLEPDFHLDPFAVPPPAVSALDTLREEMAQELGRLREDKRVRLERERAGASRLARERAEAEEQRRRAEALARQVTVRVVEKRSLMVNFIPFGAGQFQQGRSGMGSVLAVSEGLLAATSIAAYFGYGALLRTGQMRVNDANGVRTVEVRYIPTSSKEQANLLSNIKWISAGGFYGVYALGVADALWHHRDEVVRTSVESPPEPPEPPRARLHLVPLSGGAGAGVSGTF